MKFPIEIDNKSLKKYYNKVVTRRFKDMKDRYKNSEGIKGNPVIYRVYISDFQCFEVGLTVIEPGTINKEYYMTFGHKHVKPTKEIYILISGKGKLLVKGKSLKVFDLKKGKTYILPKGEGHRIVNTGNKKLEVLTIYMKTAGHDYKFSFDKSRMFFKR